MRKSFVLVAMLTFLGMLFSSPTFAAKDEVDCELLLSTYIGLFPNGSYSVPKTSPNRTNLEINTKYEQALTSLPKEIEAVPLTYFLGGQNSFQSIDHLVGRTIVGANFVHSYEDPQFRYTAGQITAAKIIRDPGFDRIQITVETANGLEDQLLHAHFYNRPENPHIYEFFILDGKKSAESRVRQAFEFVNFPQAIEEIFGAPVQPEDFEVAYKAVETYLSLPPTWGIPGTIKTLRGLHDKSKRHKNFGIVAKNRRYGPKALEKFLRQAEGFMRNLQLIELRELSSDDFEFDGLRIKSSIEKAGIFLEMLSALKVPGTKLHSAQNDNLPPTSVDLTKAAAQLINFNHVSKMLNLLYFAVVKNQQHLKPKIEGKTATVSSRFLLRGTPQRAKPFPLTQIKKIKNNIGCSVIYRIDTEKLIQLDVAKIWFYLDPIVEVQFKENSTEVLSLKYYWSLSFRTKAENFLAPELAGEAASITVDFATLDSYFQNLLKSK